VDPKGTNLIYSANAFDEFGYSVDIKDGGEVIAIGSPGEHSSNGLINDSGAVRVYKWGSTARRWEQVEDVIEGTASMVGLGILSHFLRLASSRLVHLMRTVT
jgi:hypothetical protein